ncbi:MAG: dienelactone hydrolase family protein [Gemmatimonadales bacterium]|nr:MAG: dienelactone hydrolase family protein [Gemmatimonadales bacterium]
MYQRIIALYDRHTHGGLGRREFLDRLGRMVGGASAAAAIVPLLQNDYSRRLVPDQDPRLVISEASWPAPGARMTGYLARLRGGERRPAVIVIHENRGLNPHIQDVARRFALDGFLALAPDMLSPLGGTPSDEDRAREMLGTLGPEETLTRLAAAVPFLSGHPESTGKVAAVGFCWGGGYANQLAAAGTTLNASVPYYGRQLAAEDVPRITAPLCLHYAGLDERINGGIAGYEAALRANGKPYEIYLYEGANHAFNNDTNAARYNREAATLAWSRTVAFLRRYLTP